MLWAFPQRVTGSQNGCCGAPNTALIGTPPHVLPWHPEWPDFKVVLEELKPFFTDNSQRLLLLSNEPTALSLALADNGERVHRLRCMPFLKMPVERLCRVEGKDRYLSA